ncbi:GD18006 [Drosophila simulans]|uniref:GD18006 n=1 Tax=Drosophila simulans TaxID=7240 RepID=B4QZE2_DROSI|nr:GD18006 [Drosophila simulans]
MPVRQDTSSYCSFILVRQRRRTNTLSAFPISQAGKAGKNEASTAVAAPINIIVIIIGKSGWRAVELRKEEMPAEARILDWHFDTDGGRAEPSTAD